MPNPPWLAYGLSQLGVHEFEGTPSSPQIEAYFNQVGFERAYKDDIA